MSRSRILLSKLFVLTGQHNKGYQVLKQGIINLSLYSNNKRMV